jgi:lysozyme family protein
MHYNQAYWNRVYTELDNDIERIAAQTGRRPSLDIYLDIGGARFLIDKGRHAEAIQVLDRIASRLAEVAGPQSRSVTRGGGASAQSFANLDKLSDELNAETRLGSARLEITGEAEEEPPPPTRDGAANTRVNRSIVFADIEEEYIELFERARIRPEKLADVSKAADRIVANRAVYDSIAMQTKVPWFFTGLVHGMECSFSFKKHLHNGDTLNGRTLREPKNRPKDGEPPFSFEESAIDALDYDKFTGKTDWPLAMILYRLERYNGMGYRKKFGIASPYLWSFTNHHVRGKYVQDGVWDPNAETKQIGAAAMLRDLMNRGLVKPGEPAAAAAPAPVQAPAPVPAPAPIPAPAPVPSPAPAAVPAVDIHPIAPDRTRRS